MILLEFETSQSRFKMLSAALYIHIPWCIRKCPYCDFNSHKSPDSLPETAYVNALIEDMQKDLESFPTRKISTVFIGGGTPSLLSAEAYAQLFEKLRKLLPFEPGAEITLEANPGTVEQRRFKAYREAGINRLSLGIQSFHPHHLKKLGRIHNDLEAHTAIETARTCGFDNLNLDIMHSLPGQSFEEGMEDLKQALAHQPEHLSWYQLTLEPNTVFYKQQPQLPDEDIIDQLESAGISLLKKNCYQRYEISAYSLSGRQSRHNMNYWLFGDYYGIGAGAHGKITLDDGRICRTQKHRQPSDYLNPAKVYATSNTCLNSDNLIFEFMLNTSRLEQIIPHALFQQTTGLPFKKLANKLQQAADMGLITLTDTHWQVTEFGRRFTCDLQSLFLEEGAMI